MLADKINPLYVYLKQCFDKLKKYHFEIITTENLDQHNDQKFQSISFFNGKKVSVGLGMSKKESKIQCARFSIEDLAKKHPDIKEYFYKLPHVRHENLDPRRNSDNRRFPKKTKTNQPCIVREPIDFSFDVKEESSNGIHSQVVKEYERQRQIDSQSIAQNSINIGMSEEVYNQEQFEASKKATLLSQSLALNEQDQNYYNTFLSKLQVILSKEPILLGHNIQSIGSYNLKAMRNNRLELDLIISLNQQQIVILAEILQASSHDLDIREIDMEDFLRIVVVLNKICSKNQDRRYNYSPSLLQVILIVHDTSITETIPLQVCHNLFMDKYKENISSSAHQSLLLVRQWRDSSGMRMIIPIDILDFLVTQVTCEFQVNHSPYVILRQVICLLQQDILTQILNLQHKNCQINPFIGSIQKLHFQLIFNLGVLKDQIQIVALTWDQIKTNQWIGELYYQ